MLTDRLQKIRTELQSRKEKTAADHELLEILNNMDRFENFIAFTDNKDLPLSTKICQVIVRPAKDECLVCGRFVRVEGDGGVVC